MGVRGLNDELEFQCKGCGEIDSIEGVSAVPRAQGCRPNGEGGVDWKDTDVAFWEAETMLGFGCSNDKCQFWQGQYGTEGDFEDGTLRFVVGKKLDEIARIVVLDNDTGEYVAPMVELGL